MAAPTDSVEISALTAGAALDGTEILPMVQAGATVRNPLSAALTYFNANASLAAARITSGQLALARGGTGADLSATGGANQVVRQNSAGGVFTVSALAAADIPNLDAGKITTGTLAVARGGTGIASYTVGDLLYASGATTLAVLAGVATGNVLLSGGVATAPAWGKVDVTAHITGIVPSANGGTGINNAGRTLTISTNSGTLAFGAAASTLTIPATGTAALLATANIFTATQSIYDSGAALGITLAGAAAGGTVAITATSPAQVASATAGTPLSITASPAIAGSSNAGAAAGGDVTITAGNAARLTSGNANGGNITLQGGAGIGSGTLGQVLIASLGSAAAPSLAFIGDTDTGIYSSSANRITIASGGGASMEMTNLALIGSSGITYGWTSSASAAGSSNDTGLKRNAAAVVEINNGTAGQWGSLKAGTRDSATNTTSVGLTLGHQSTGTPAASFGIGLKMALNSDTTADQDAAQIEAIWTTATHASRTSKLDFKVVKGAGALTSRLTINDGTNAAALYVPWITGDTLPIISAGSTGAGSNQIAVEARSNSGTAAVYGVNVSGIGVNAITTSGSGRAMVAQSGSGAALDASSASGNAVEAYAAAVGVSPYYGRNSTNATNTTALILNLDHLSSGTPAAGFGSKIQLTLKSSTTGSQNALDINTTWVVATHASRTARTVFNIYDTAAREVLRLEASGTAAMIGFLGANAAVRQTSGADLTNNVASGGTDDTIANFTDLTVYANDSAAIRNDIYQLARKLKQVNDALRLYGLLT